MWQYRTNVATATPRAKDKTDVQITAIITDVDVDKPVNYYYFLINCS
jgi:hypothetical protein